MNKVILGIIALGSTCCGALNAGTMGPLAERPAWNGVYLGANAGYWWSHEGVNTVGTPAFANPLFPLGATDIANALATLGTNRLSNDLKGFIGGGQFGYNYQVLNRLVAGVEAEIDGLARSNKGSTTHRTVALAHFPETYTATISARKKIDALGTVKGRLGVLFNPTVLIYGAGGFAYGNVSLHESFIASESLGTDAYPVVFENTWRKKRSGWTAGGGIEWMFKPNWSAQLEYSYYDLGRGNNNLVLNQINNVGVIPTLWGSAHVTSSSRFTAEAIRVGLNYHFA